ncbi:tetratricopeptide repeat protein [Microbacteriaceae bacterium MWH-Ta3]|nr:tetratricopeptide repeat protein [Microbacteriaceae bacterium MWH-Ta3]
MSSTTPHIGAELKSERLRRGLTLDDVAHSICSYSYLSLVESGKRNPSPRIETALRARLGLPTTESPGLYITNVDYQMAFIAYRRNEIPQWQEFLGRLPEDSNETLHLLALADEHEGNLDRAVALYLEVLESTPAPIEFHVRVAIGAIRALCGRTEYLRAVTIFDDIVDRYSEVLHHFPSMHIELWAMMANVFAETNQLSRATAALHTLAGLKPADAEDTLNKHWGAADAYRTVGDWAQAEHHTTEMLRLVDRRTHPHKWAANTTNLVTIALNRGTREYAAMIVQQYEALHTLHELHSAHEERQARLNLALLYALAQDPTSAQAELFGITEHIARHPGIESGDMHVELARVYLALNDTASALDALTRATQMLDDSPHTRTSAIAWRTMADLYERAGDTVAAASCLKQALDRLGIHSTLEVVPLVFDPSMP